MPGSQEGDVEPRGTRLVSSQLERALYPGAPRLLVAVLVIIAAGVPLLQALNIRLADFSVYMESVGFDGTNMAGLMGIFMLYLCASPGRREAWTLLALAVWIEACLYSTRPLNFSPPQRLNLVGIGFAIAGLLGLIKIASSASSRPVRQRALGLLSVAGILISYGTVSVVFLRILSHLTPLAYDAHVYKLELATGTPVPMLVASFLQAHALLGYLVLGVYLRISFLVASALCLNVINPRYVTGNLILGFVLAMLLAFPMFLILPMVGIDDFLGVPPWPHGPAPQDFAIKPVASPDHLPRTCSPSLHGTWIYLFFFSVYRYGPRIAWPAALASIATLLGTMSLTVGHYFVDIVIAFPLAVGIQAFITFSTRSNRQQRHRLAAAGLLAAASNNALLRLAPWLAYDHAFFYWLFQLLLVLAFARAEYLLGRLTLSELADVPSADDTPEDRPEAPRRETL